VSDTRLRRLADVLVGYSTQVRQGDLVLIEAPALAAPLVREVQSAVLHAGGHPLTRIAIDGLAENLLVNGSDEQLEFVNPVRIDEIETGDVRIVLEGYWNTKALTGVDPARQARFSRAREQLRNRYLERAADRAYLAMHAPLAPLLAVLVLLIAYGFLRFLAHTV